MASIYSAVYSTTRLDGATLVPSPILPPSALAASSSSSTLPTLLVLQPSQLILLLPTLKALASSPVVIQVSTSASKDHSQVLALRGSGLSLLYTSSPDVAKSHSLVAARVAATGHGVVHFGEFDAKVDFGFDESSASYVQGKDKASNGNGESNGSGASHEGESSVSSAFGTAFGLLPASLRRSAQAYSGSESPKTLIVALGNTSAFESSLPSDFALVSVSLFRPLSPSQIRSLVPSSVETVVVLEQSYKKASKWSPLFLDVVGAFAEEDDESKVPTILSGTLGEVKDASSAIKAITGSFT